MGATPGRVARIEGQIADPEFIILVAEAGDEVVGYGVPLNSRLSAAEFGRENSLHPNEGGPSGYVYRVAYPFRSVSAGNFRTS